MCNLKYILLYRGSFLYIHSHIGVAGGRARKMSSLLELSRAPSMAYRVCIVPILNMYCIVIAMIELNRIVSCARSNEVGNTILNPTLHIHR